MVLLALCLGLILGTASMYKATIVQDDVLADKRVEVLAKAIVERLNKEIGQSGSASFNTLVSNVSRSFERPEQRFQIWADNGSTLLASHNAPTNRPYLPVNQTGYQQIFFDGIYFCAFSAATADGKLLVHVAEPTPSRQIPIGWLAYEYFEFALIPFAIVLFINGFLLRRFFSPFATIAQDLNFRSPADAKQIGLDDMPKEVEPLIRSLNVHLQRMELALSTESRFTSVAAHELKTPLAGVRGQAQVAQFAQNHEELSDALKRVMRGVDACSHIVDQLIDFHRVDSLGDQHAWRGAVTNLTLIRHQALEEFEPRAASKNIKLKIAFDIDQMHGFEIAIWTLLRNLICNAIQYTPNGGDVEVRIKQRDLRVVLSVDDSGPGIPAENRERSLQKFDRLGRRGTDGVGLGLSIVSNVASIHQALLELKKSTLGGLRVEVQFHGTEVSDNASKDSTFLIKAARSWSSASQP